MYIRNISGHFKYKRKNLDSVFLLPYHFAKNPLHLLAIMTELTEFERGIIIGAWLFDHSEREIEAKTGYAKSTIHDTIERLVVEHPVHVVVDHNYSVIGTSGIL